MPGETVLQDIARVEGVRVQLPPGVTPTVTQYPYMRAAAMHTSVDDFVQRRLSGCFSSVEGLVVLRGDGEAAAADQAIAHVRMTYPD